MNFKYNRRLIVYLCVLVALLPLVCFRDVTPDNELRYLSIADEALRHNHGFAFYSHGEPYADKPPLYIWLAMLARWLFDDDAGLFLMLFSVIPAFVVAEVMDRWSRPALSEDCSVMATLLLLSCGLFAGMMAFLRMDMLMTMWIVLLSAASSCAGRTPALPIPRDAGPRVGGFRCSFFWRSSPKGRSDSSSRSSPSSCFYGSAEGLSGFSCSSTGAHGACWEGSARYGSHASTRKGAATIFIT